MTTKQKLATVHIQIAKKLDEIDEIFQAMGLHLPKLTFIARDPAQGGMVLALSNDDIPNACAQVLAEGKKTELDHADLFVAAVMSD